VYFHNEGGVHVGDVDSKASKVRFVVVCCIVIRLYCCCIVIRLFD
jgi:hypothetical protein